MKRVDVDLTTKLLVIKYKFLKKDIAEKRETEKRIFTLKGRIYSAAMKAWLCPTDDFNIRSLYDWGFSFPEDFPELVGQRPKIKKLDPAIYNTIPIPRYLKFLRPYQKECFQFLSYRNGRALIGDDMGIGKTVEAIGWIKHKISEGNALIVVPAITKPQWMNSFKRWVNSNVEIIYGKRPHRLEDKNYIINWEILTFWELHLQKLNFTTLVADECQYAGNSKSKRTRTLKRLAKHIPYFLPMSGTPINSKPKQFFPILNMLDPCQFSNEWRFLNRYCSSVRNGFNNFDGATNTEELYNKVNKLMIRRLKREVKKDLPPVTQTVVPLEVKLNKKYYDLEQFFFDTYGVHEGNKIQSEKALSNLKIEIFEMKKESIFAWIDDFMESGKKLVVGTWHKQVIETLYNKYKGVSTMINGSIIGKKREKALDLFYTEKDLLFLQMRSGGVGLDGLQHVCSDAILVELGDTPTIMDQFIARLDRSGQKDAVDIRIMIGEGTTEEDLLYALDEVRKNIDAVVDGKKTFSKDLLSILWQRRKK